MSNAKVQISNQIQNSNVKKKILEFGIPLTFGL
jgi:hypothetical protein